MIEMPSDARVYVAGHRGLAGYRWFLENREHARGAGTGAAA